MSSRSNQNLTPAGENALNGIAQRFGLGYEAVATLLHAVAAGGGGMAQFHHADLGGGGQWMRGGMTMVGDMFNDGLRTKVSGACAALAELLEGGGVFEAATHNSPSQGGTGMKFAEWKSAAPWWPEDLGSPSSSGGQNDMQYAYFPSPHRLAISEGGRISIYDTLDHQIGGVQQQQGGGTRSLTFTSQNGTFAVDSLRRADGGGRG